MAIPRDPSLREVNAPQPGEAPRAPLALKVIAGERRGETIALDQANTLLGATGSDTALVVKRGQGFFLARFGGSTPRLNGRDLPPGVHALSPKDMVDVGGFRYEVVQVDR
jgi:hypothetical protein